MRSRSVRAFRTAFDQSPTQFRQQPDWAEWHRRVPKHTLQEQTSMDVNIISCPSTRIAVLQHRGSGPCQRHRRAFYRLA